MAQAVVVKKQEKQENVLCQMTNRFDEEEFKKLFKEMYPDDWQRIKQKYAAEERKDEKGKGHPMPHPEKYLSNMYKVALKKYQQSRR